MSHGLVLLAQHLLALLHLSEVAQLVEELVEALVEPGVIPQQAAQLDLLKLHHQRQRWFTGVRRRRSAAGIASVPALALNLVGVRKRWWPVAPLFEPFGSRLFGIGAHRSFDPVRRLVEHREKPTTPLETLYFSAIYAHSQSIGADPKAACRHRQG
ncbi:MAG: hypothetical protein ACTSQ7_10175 [Alphaproteobacteria bacterium]